MNNYLDIKQEVNDALKQGKAVVALESTIISHGMPYPQNVEMAKKVESVIRTHGAVPATIAMMNGKIKIGLEDGDLEALAKSDHVEKVSRRDMASVLAKGIMGATTVASTMICAKMAGIKFFVTGGIGGVHRGFESTMDVSADLDELSKTNVNVICAGAKAILDLPRTMEYLETKGVPVVGYQTKVLPAFYTRETDIHLQLSEDTPEELASLILTKDQLQLSGGVLIVNPIPKKDSLASSLMNEVIDDAINDANNEGIHGKDVTPYLLAKIVEKTEGKSLQANLALVYHNAMVGAQLAVAYEKLNH